MLRRAERPADASHQQQIGPRIHRAVVGLAREVGGLRGGDTAGTELQFGVEADQEAAHRRLEANTRGRIDGEALVLAEKSRAARRAGVASLQRLLPAVERDAAIDIEE